MKSTQNDALVDSLATSKHVLNSQTD